MKVLKFFRNLLVWLFVIIAVGMIIFTIVSVSTFTRTDRSLFGYKAFIVLSDSMKKTDFDAGDLVLIKRVDPTTLQPGDIIAYTSQNSANYGATVTHKIRSLTTDTDDETVVTYPYVLGKYTGHIPGVGTFFNFLKTTPGYIVCILVPFVLLIVMEGIHCIRLFRKYKAEQRAELHAERAKLDADRAEIQKMMQELLAMKAQLGDPTSEENSVNKHEI